MKTLYNKSEILKKAHFLKSKKSISFSEALKESWLSYKINLSYKMREIIRVSRIEENINKAKETLSKIRIEDFHVKRTNLVLDSESVRLFYAK